MKIFFILFLFLFHYTNAQEYPNAPHHELTKTEKQWIKNNPIIIVQNEQDWEPFNYNQNNTPSGHSIDYMRLLASKVGLKVNFIQGHSWKEYLEMLKNGHLDVMVNIAKTPQREQYFSYTSEYHKVLSSLYICEDNGGTYNSLKNLEGKTVSVVEGMIGESVLRKNYPKINIYSVKTSLEALKAVVYGKADGVVQINTLGNRLIKQYNLKCLKPIFEINDPKFNMHLHLATKKDNLILKNILQKGMLQINKNELEQLRKKHFIDEKQNTLNLTTKELDWLQHNQNIKIGIPNFQAPLLIKNKNSFEGVLPDFLQLISKKTGIELKITPIASKKETLKPVSELGVDATLIIQHPNLQTTPTSLFTNQFLTFPMVIASLEKSPIYNGLDDHHLKKLAIPKHSPLRAILKADYPHIEHILVKGSKEGLNSLLTHKADAYVCNPHVIAYTLRSMGVSGVAITSITPHQLGFTLKTSNENIMLHSILNKAVESLSNKEIQHIKQKWQQLELQKVPDYSRYFQIAIILLIIVSGIIIWVYWWNKLLRHEIKQKEIAQRNALEKERQLSTLLDNIPGMAYRAKNEPDWPMIDVNHAAYGLTGYTREEFIEQTILYNDIIVETDRERVWKEVQTALHKKTDYYIEYQVQTKIGEIKWVWERGRPIYSETGELIWLEGLIVDNSIIKEIELNLQSEQNKVLQQKTILENIFDNSATFMVILNNDGNIIFFNSFAEQLSGYKKEEVLGKNWFSTFIPDSEHTNIKNIFKDVITNINMHNDYINPIISKDGSLHYIRWRNSTYLEENQEYLLGVGNDITEELKIESLYKDLHESMQDAYGMIDLNGNLTDVNEMASELLGYTKEEFLNMNLKDITPKKWLEVDQKHHAELLVTKTCTEVFEKEFIHKDGKIIPAEVRICAIKNAAGDVEGFWGLIRDISELRKKEEMLITQSRSAAMGDMISMIAHQWKQPLAALSMIANNMKADYELDTFETKYIEEYYSNINMQVQHLADTIDDFRDFFKPNKTKQVVLVQDIIDDTLKMIDKSLENNNVQLVKEFQDVGEVSIFSNELFHILLNIINNAKEILIQRDIKDKKIFISTYKDNGNIFIEIEDNAGGIKEEILDKIFDPYFTTKEAMNGTGLGLYMAKTIVEKHFMGKIEVKNTKQGAKFTLIIPA